MKRIGDLISLPELKTVVHLKDALGPEGKQLKTELVFTKEVSRAFQAIYYSLAEEKGKGFFIEGGYGSGKSHFLAALYLYLSAQEIPPLPEMPKPKGPWLVVPISLLDYSSEIRLQEIVLEAINAALQSQFACGFIPISFLEQLRLLLSPYKERLVTLRQQLGIAEDELFSLKYWPYLNRLIQELALPYRPVLERKTLFEHLKKILSEKRLKGVVLLIDELSEFLKAKSSAGEFQEDIRFLQFLGEMTSELPLWIVATLQERIETTGDIPQEAFAKIKDRYPVRLLFEGSHIEEIVSERLVKKRPGARAYLQELYQQFKQTFNYLPFDWEKWYQLYPVHPLTIQLLDELRGLFSQHRGAVDFVYSRLKGDPKRQIPSLLEAPAQTLLSPTLIFDHFLDRIRETLETNPYYERVYCLYTQLIPKLFPDPDTQKVALQLIKLLILLAISPIQHRPSTKELTLSILYPFTDLDPTLNFRFIHDILTLFAQEGAYLRHEPEENFLKDKFYLDLEEDTQFIIKKRYEQLKKELSPKDSRVYNFIFTHVHASFIPLAELYFNETLETEIIWQNTRRKGRIYFLETDKLLSVLEEINTSLHTADFFLLILKHPLKEGFIPPAFPPGVGIWEPGEIDEEVLQKAYIYGQLLECYQNDTTHRGQRLKEAVQELFQDSLKQAVQEIIWSYRQGILYLSEKDTTQVVIFSQNNWNRFLESMAALLLEKRYPLHHLIAPHTLPPPLFQRQHLAERVIIPGEAIIKQGEKSLKMLIEGLLRPLGIVKKIPGGYRIAIEGTRSPLLKEVLTLFQSQPVWKKKALYEHLRWGEFGFCQEQYDFLLLAFIHTGILIPYRQNKRLPAIKINLSNLDKIDTLEQVKTLDLKESEFLTSLPFLPSHLQKNALAAKQILTITQQEALWQFLKKFKEKHYPKVQALEAFFTQYKSHPLFSAEALELAQETIQKFKALLEAIKVSLPFSEGLKRFCRALKDITFLDILYARWQSLEEFYEKRNRILFIYNYLNHPDLQIPSDQKELSVLCQAARAVILKENLLFQPKAISMLEEKFQAFFKAYTYTYAKAHHLQFAPERFAPYFQLRQKDEYKLLKTWAGIPVLPARAFLEEIEAELNQILRQMCRQEVLNCLQEAPVCACGWHLGEKLFLPPLAQLKARIQEGITACLKVLQSSPLSAQLKEYLEGLKAIGEKKLAQEIENTLKSPQDIKSLMRLTPHLKKAFSQGIKIVERNLDSLITRLRGQSLTKAQIIAIFTEWLEGKEKLSPETYVKITTSASGVPPALELAIREYDTSFLPLVKKWQERFFTLLLYVAWCHLHNLPVVLATELAQVPETEWQQQQASLLKLALKCLEEGAFKEWAQKIEDEEVLWQYLKNYQPDLSLALSREKLFPRLKNKILAVLLERGEKIPLEGLDEDTQRLIKSYKALETLTQMSLPSFSERKEWESFYKEKLLLFETHLGILLTSHLPQTTIRKLIKHCLSWRKRLDEAFISFYKQQKYMPLKLPSQGMTLLLDGMRWDLWEEIKRAIFLPLGYKLEAEGSYWAKAPTDTFTQLMALGLDPYFKNLAPGLHLMKKGKLHIFKIDLIDTYIHKTHILPHILKGELISSLKKTLSPLIKTTKCIFVFSDHGFRLDIRVALTDAYKKTLYTHGKISPEEVIVPWARWRK
jgi:hypothetical protein